MGTLRSLVAKDMRRRLSAPAGVLISLAIPLAIAGVMALTFGGMAGGMGHPVIRVVVADLDKTPLSYSLSGSSQNPEAAEHLDVRMAESREEGLEIMKEEDYAALLVIPEGFMEAILDGGKAELELVKNPAQQIMPVVAEQAAQALALYISTGARFLTPADIQRLRKLVDGEGWEDAAGLAATITDVYIRVRRSEALLFPPLITVETQDLAEDEEEDENGFNFFSWMYPGMIVMGLLFVAQTQMKDLLQEGRSGTLRRQLAAPVSPTTILVSKILSVALVVALSLGILLGMGSLFFDMRWGGPGALILVAALLTLAATGFSALVFSLVKTESQGDALGGILIMLMSLLGGAFIPPQAFPPGLQFISRLTLNHWANEALRILAGGGAWSDLRHHLAVLAAIGAVLAGTGVLVLRRRHLRGAL